MSIRFLHIIFVISSILLSLGLGVGLLMMYGREGGGMLLAMGLGWLVLGVSLMVYGKAVVRKLRTLAR
ncbi:MAG: hypothetical protein RI897_2430 [Verrucomicrobiota bacterium]|jgi:hypothetical protein